MTPKWGQGGPRWSLRTQIPNCFEAGLEMTPKWSHFGVHFGVFFELIFGDFLEPAFFRIFGKTGPQNGPQTGSLFETPDLAQV